MLRRNSRTYLLAGLAIAAVAVALLAIPSTAQAGFPRCGVGYGGWGGGWGGYGCSSFRVSFGCGPRFCAPIRYCAPITYCRPVNYCWPTRVYAPVRYYNPCFDPYYGMGYSTGYSSFGFYGYSSNASVANVNGLASTVRSSYYYPTATNRSASLSGIAANPALRGSTNPQSLERFLDLDRAVASTTSPMVKPKIVAPPLVAKKPFDLSKVRVANAQQQATADRWIAQGDVLFSEQKFHSAAQRYKLAAEAAPDHAEAYYRLGHANVACNSFNEAAFNFRRAIALNPAGVARDGFDLNKLYGSATIARDSHVEGLAGLALADEANSDMLFLLGMTLKYQGHADRAEQFFVAAAKLETGDSTYLANLLPAKKPAAEGKLVLPVSADLEI